MLNVNSGEEFVDNPKLTPLDPLLGSTAVVVYESWATEIGVSTTGTLAGMGMITEFAGNHAFLLNLGFTPFRGVNNFIEISTEGGIYFHSDTVAYNLLNVGFITGVTTVGVVNWNSINKMQIIDYRYLASLFFRKNPALGVSLLSGSRFQSDGIDSIVYLKWTDCNVALRFNSVDQTLDMYVENTDSFLEFQTLVYDYASGTVYNDTPDTSLSGVSNFISSVSGTLKRYVFGKPPLATISGNVRESFGNPIIRKVTAINQITKEMKDTTTSDVNGDFVLNVDPLVDYIVIAEDTDPNPKNALVFDRINVAL